MKVKTNNKPNEFPTLILNFLEKLSYSRTDLYLCFADWNKLLGYLYSLALQPFSFSYIQENPKLAALHVSTHSVFLLSMQPDCFYLSFSILQNKKNKGKRRMKRDREKQKYIYVVSYFLFPQGLISKYKLSQGLFLGG